MSSFIMENFHLDAEDWKVAVKAVNLAKEFYSDGLTCHQWIAKTKASGFSLDLLPWKIVEQAYLLVKIIVDAKELKDLQDDGYDVEDLRQKEYRS